MGMKCVFENQYLEMFGFKLSHIFHQLEVVCRGNEAQLEVGENLKQIT